MATRVRQSYAIHADETPVTLLQPRRAAYAWVYLGDAANPFTVFDLTPGRSQDHPTRFLAGYTGFVHADALQQYADVYAGGAAHVGCFAHARRKFVAAADAGDGRADEAVGLIRRLYAVERALPPLDSSPDAEAVRHARRQAEAVPVLAALRARLDRHAPAALPKSPLGQAITYAVRNWAALVRYVEHGFLSIDNNLAERTLRPVAVGRNNWGVIGSAAAGPTAAVLYSVVGTCKHLGIDPFAYLRDVLPRLHALAADTTDEQLTPLLPDRWRADRSKTATPPAA
ncbi:IS66 family transposase [Limnoglobus roseus]|uniref:IS66 family transposase n=1 Tax=Limnoglobus roseus TaxID=2598579 RepID=A0A5C1A4X4_9BACT|nr:IS66 family transposase [Limnoglobus roseus]